MAIKVPAVAGKIIHIGRAGENLATTVTFDVSDWIENFGSNGTFSLFVQQGGNEYYPQVLVESSAALIINNIVEWEVTSSNTATIGLGKCELVYTINEVIVKSIIYDIVVTNSIDIEAAGNIPSPVESWINEVSQMTDEIANAAIYAEQAEQAAQRVEDLAIGNVTTGVPGSDAAVVKREEEEGIFLDFTIPRGNTGSTGERGSKWYIGTAITGTSTTPSIFSNSGITSALIDDQYLNTNTGNTYKCTTGGTASVARWIYSGNIKGPQGTQGETGQGLEISGQVNSVANLPSSFQSKGTIYAVGTAETGVQLYIQNNTSSPNNWVNLGTLGGASITLVTWTV